MPTITSEQFMEQYKLPIEAASDFHIGGASAEWAASHPKDWGQEDDSIVLPNNGMENGELRGYSSFSGTVSYDYKLLAVCSKSKIRIYDIATKELRQTLDGTGLMQFRPFTPTSDTQKHDEGAGGQSHSPAYMLLSSTSVPRRSRSIEIERPELIFWELDRNGRLLDEEEPIDVSGYASKAIEGIAGELEQKHEWSRDFIDGSTLLEEFGQALEKVAAEHRRLHNTIIPESSIGGPVSRPFSHDGKRLLYNVPRGHVTVVWDVDASTELFRLSGHKDNILWMGFSPDDKHIATVAWDGTMRMHSADDGALEWIADAGGQCWVGAFSNDSKYIAWTCQNGQELWIHQVEDGKKINQIQVKFTDWCRRLAWNSDNKQLALCVGGSAMIWRPFDEDEKSKKSNISQHYELPKDKTFYGFAEIDHVEWADNDRKLVLSITDGTYLVWDSQTNTKEMFKKTTGIHVAWTSSGFFYIPGDNGGTYITLNGDGNVRFWKPSGPTERALRNQEEGSGVQHTHIEEERVTSAQAVMKEGNSAGSRDAWAEKGAELWTAE
ncbi:WD40 repeat-like protein [Polyplosphaeria fusca]|uniref:WD40 repeat-like protein n=1 Tax=Polyplosphaeria fusca TaxID=682080 RepID=A0A9P4UWQ6_9PLEO|nr:WD40 repeat-like protein [Polyplosphaeria fusca]